MPQPGTGAGTEAKTRRVLTCGVARKGGWKDWSLKTVILDGDWTFVTKNSIDFRGPASEPGSKGQYGDVAVHAGLICLNEPEGMDLGAGAKPSERTEGG
jgi:hypothetical protein